MVVGCIRPGGAASTSAAGAAKQVLRQAVETVKQPLQSLVEAALPKSPQMRLHIAAAARFLQQIACHRVLYIPT